MVRARARSRWQFPPGASGSDRWAREMQSSLNAFGGEIAITPAQSRRAD